MIAPCTLTHLMTDSDPPKLLYLDQYEEKFIPLINAYKIVYQRLQLDIISDESDTLEIGKSFEKLDEAFEKIINLLKRA